MMNKMLFLLLSAVNTIGFLERPFFVELCPAEWGGKEQVMLTLK